MENAEAWCAHTMTAKEEGSIVCCDCGRRFKDAQHLERVQHYETETGLIMDAALSTPTSQP